LADTRNTSVMAGNTTRTFNVAGLCGIPSSARAYSLNVTVVPQTGNLAFLTLYPTGQSQPLASTLNSPQGLVVANAALVPAGNGGAVNVYVTDATHVVLDINGYFDSGASALPFFALTPCRIADTRNSGPILGNGETRNFALAGACGLPGSAAAYSLNVTAVPTGFLGFLSMFPTGQALPPVSTLNSADGRVVANAALVPAGSNGAVSAYVTNSSHVVLDTNGYFGRTGTGSPLLFYPLTPCRVADTRTAGGVLQPGARAFSMTAQSACGVPASARAVSLNVTVVPQTSFLGFLSIWPADQSQPLVSTLNSPRGAIVANAAIVPISTAGAVNVYVTDPAHVVLDVNGYFAP
jgi:hypothetical protein